MTLPVIHFTVCCHNFFDSPCDLTLVLLLEFYDGLYLT
jgi:hypothetical protein